eukprot:269789-Rhodomonas_salina.4
MSIEDVAVREKTGCRAYQLKGFGGLEGSSGSNQRGGRQFWTSHSEDSARYGECAFVLRHCEQVEPHYLGAVEPALFPDIACNTPDQMQMV